MKCTYCGFENESGDLFCNNCGRRMETDSGINNIPPVADAPYNSPQGASAPAKSSNGSDKSTAIVIAAIVAIVVCIIAVCITVGVVAKSNSSSTDEDTTVSAAEEDGEEKAFDAPTAKQEQQSEKANQTVQIYAGTRCRVKQDLDGSKSLALRSAASKNSEAKAYAGKGDYVTVAENYYGGDYIRVSLDSEGDTYYGWLLADYIYAVNDSEGDGGYSYLKAGTTCQVSNYIEGGYDSLNLWKKPRKDEGYYTKVPCGGYVTLISDYDVNDNGYVYAAYGGEKGWILAEYLDVCNENYNVSGQKEDIFGIAGEVQLPDTYCNEQTNMITGLNYDDTLPVRRGPGTSYDKLFSMENGTLLDIVGKSSSDSKWVLICCTYEGYGWVNSDYLISVESIDEYFEREISCYADVPAGDVLPLRRGAGTSYAKIAELDDGEHLEAIGCNKSGKWWFVEYGNLHGWVNSEYLD